MTLFFCPVQNLPELVREASAHPGLLTAKGEEWRTARNTLSPSFSTAKIKAVSTHHGRVVSLVKVTISMLLLCKAIAPTAQVN